MSMMKLASCFRRSSKARWLTKDELERLVVENTNTQTQMTNAITVVKDAIKVASQLTSKLRLLKPMDNDVILGIRSLDLAKFNLMKFVERRQKYPTAPYPGRSYPGTRSARR